jgi:hypothetical protein
MNLDFVRQKNSHTKNAISFISDFSKIQVFEKAKNKLFLMDTINPSRRRRLNAKSRKM